MTHSQSDFVNGARVEVTLGDHKMRGTLILDGEVIYWDHDEDSVTPRDCFPNIRLLTPMELLAEQSE